MIKSFFCILFHFFSSRKILIQDSISFKVMPWDLDLNFHVNNAKYLNYFNRARLVFLSKSGFLREIVSHKYQPVISEIRINYKKSLKLFNKFTVKTVFEKMNDRSLILKHLILYQDNIYTECTVICRLKGPSPKRVKELQALINNEK